MFQKIIIFISMNILLSLSFSIYADEYKGTLGSASINMSINDYDAVYLYTKFNTPIYLSQSNSDNDELVYSERDKNRKIVGEFHLKTSGESLNGYWINIKTKKKYPVNISLYNAPRGTLSRESFSDRYIRSTCQNNSKIVSIINKKTDVVVNKINIPLDTICMDDVVSVSDYNFDGYDDVSVLSGLFAGGNTISNYYLFNPKTNSYIEEPQLNLTSLTFDETSKTIRSRNQTGAGSSITLDTYKWEGKSLILIKEACYKRNEEGELLLKPREDCY